MKYIIIQNNIRVSVSEEIFRKYKSQERYEQRLIEKNTDCEMLIGDETDFDKMNCVTEHDPCEILELKETFSLIMQIISTYLSPNEQYILKSLYLEEKGLHEVAKDVGLKIHQVWYLANKSLKKVRKIYRKIR